jgi:hypothetical protein
MRYAPNNTGQEEYSEPEKHFSFLAVSKWQERSLLHIRIVVW